MIAQHWDHNTCVIVIGLRRVWIWMCTLSSCTRLGSHPLTPGRLCMLPSSASSRRSRCGNQQSCRASCFAHARSLQHMLVLLQNPACRYYYIRRKANACHWNCAVLTTVTKLDNGYWMCKFTALWHHSHWRLMLSLCFVFMTHAPRTNTPADISHFAVYFRKTFALW